MPAIAIEMKQMNAHTKLAGGNCGLRLPDGRPSKKPRTAANATVANSSRTNDVCTRPVSSARSAVSRVTGRLDGTSHPAPRAAVSLHGPTRRTRRYQTPNATQASSAVTATSGNTGAAIASPEPSAAPEDHDHRDQEHRAQQPEAPVARKQKRPEVNGRDEPERIDERGRGQGSPARERRQHDEGSRQQRQRRHE